MSDAQNLNDFFAKNTKKKQAKKKKPAQQAAAAPETDELPARSAETTPQEEAKAEAAPKTQPKPAEEFLDDSDEESINTGLSTIKDKKEVEAKRKNEAEEPSNAASGWGLGSKLGAMQAARQQNEVTVSKAAAKGPPTGGSISFGGKPTFTRSKKGTPMDQSEFPDLDQATAGSSAAAPKTKAEGAVFGGFTSTTTSGKAAGAQEERKQAKKPVFFGKAKLNTGGASNDEMANSRMNYDFSKMGLSQAKGKRTDPPKEGEEEAPQQQRRGPPRASQPASADMFDDDGFESVTEKKRTTQRRGFGDSAFGQGAPQFSRGPRPE